MIDLLPGFMRRMLLPSAARIGIWHMIADLMSAEVEIEAALRVAADAERNQRKETRARIIDRWEQALLANRFAEEVSRWVPASEAMVLQGINDVDAASLFGAAARIAEGRARQTAALTSALLMPSATFVGILAMLWFFGSEFIPIMSEISPRSRWDMGTVIFADVSLWVWRYDIFVVFGVVAFLAATVQMILRWSGRGRAAADRWPPFSLYRTLVGASFILTVTEFLKSGVDLNNATFERMKQPASRYTRSRIEAIRKGMAGGSGLGRSMVECGNDFPDPSLVSVVKALDGSAGWEHRLAGFVGRWQTHAEARMKARAMILNLTLMTVAAAVLGFGVIAMFRMMSATGAV